MICSKLRGFHWKLAKYGDEFGLDLVSPHGRKAATVFLVWDVSGYNWYVWDQQGVGGENSKGLSVAEAIRFAEQATKRWGQHIIRRKP